MVCHLQPHTPGCGWAYNQCISGVDLLDQRHLAHGPAWLTHADSEAPQAFNVSGPWTKKRNRIRNHGKARQRETTWRHACRRVLHVVEVAEEVAHALAGGDHRRVRAHVAL